MTGAEPNFFVGFAVEGGAFVRTLTPPPSVRVFAETDLHITLAFLGRVGEERALRAFAQVEQLTLAPLETRLGEVVLLGPAHRPSAFSALPVEGRARLEEAMAALRDVICDTAGAPRETRPPLAHVTFARPLRRASPKERRAAEGWARALQLCAPRVCVKRVALYTWAEDRARNLFRCVVERPLVSA
jgi:2'-5' RNA ligase